MRLSNPFVNDVKLKNTNIKDYQRYKAAQLI